MVNKFTDHGDNLVNNLKNIYICVVPALKLALTIPKHVSAVLAKTGARGIIEDHEWIGRSAFK